MTPFDYTSTRWKHKRLAILRRDGYKCQRCKRYGRAVEELDRSFEGRIGENNV